MYVILQHPISDRGRTKPRMALTVCFGDPQSVASAVVVFVFLEQSKVYGPCPLRNSRYFFTKFFPFHLCSLVIFTITGNCYSIILNPCRIAEMSNEVAIRIKCLFIASRCDLPLLSASTNREGRPRSGRTSLLQAV